VLGERPITGGCKTLPYVYVVVTSASQICLNAVAMLELTKPLSQLSEAGKGKRCYGIVY